MGAIILSDAERIPIAVDAMGGDHAPEEIVAGAILAHREGLGRMLLVGDQARIAPLLGKKVAQEIEIVHVPDAVAMDETPSVAVRKSTRTSLGLAVDLVAQGRAQGVVSAGNSGAFLAIALVRLRTIAGIARPAIAAVLPSRTGAPVVLLDAGANVDCRPEWLAQFGVMGSAYARGALGIERPRVGIISIGEEATKGNTQVLEAARLLEHMPVYFVGNVEGKDFLGGQVDVCVTDGFVGNVMLKLSEGLARMLADVVTHELRSGGVFAQLGALLVRPSFARLRRRISYDTYGGAPLLGVRGNCIVAHGRANRLAIRSAIRAAVAEAREGVVARIAELVDSTKTSEET
ncbi:MAG TPA: phosphate acyltransferase PlsX [Candidatus Baltobacteraceae bacterium]|jgi:glycerol-3-phosphate acyltransferase PlsX|nr:phosphate acyltransferase PlsX [Candidatus Baltobacteraceae bacterium]